jgi:hypothetical protein
VSILYARLYALSDYITLLAVVFLSQLMFGLVVLMFNKFLWLSTMTCLRMGLDHHVNLSRALTVIEFHRNRENYIHRIGRSGRFGRKGVAINVSNVAYASTIVCNYHHQFVTVDDVRILRDIGTLLICICYRLYFDPSSIQNNSTALRLCVIYLFSQNTDLICILT